MAIEMQSTSASWATVFANGLSPYCQPPDLELLEAIADSAWRRAHSAHPAITVTAEELFAFIAERIRDGDPAAELQRRNVEDLYLACACNRGETAGLATFEKRILPATERGLGNFGDREEILQILRERMLVEKDGRRGIAAYDGRAPLVVWLRVCATRIGIREAARQRRATEIEDRQLDELAPGVPDPELAYLKRLYGGQFRTAFGEAVASLAARERTLLRHSVIDGLGIDQIAAIYHIHRATAARQLKQARATLVEATRHRMGVALGISGAELESIMRMIVSMADLTLRQVLANGRGRAQYSD